LNLLAHRQRYCLSFVLVGRVRLAKAPWHGLCDTLVSVKDSAFAQLPQEENMPGKLVIADLSRVDGIERKQMCNVRGGMVMQPAPMPGLPPGAADFLANMKSWLEAMPTYKPSGGSTDPDPGFSPHPSPAPGVFPQNA
jgi:hypothetical protein